MMNPAMLATAAMAATTDQRFRMWSALHGAARKSGVNSATVKCSFVWVAAITGPFPSARDSACHSCPVGSEVARFLVRAFRLAAFDFALAFGSCPGQTPAHPPVWHPDLVAA